MNGRRWMILSVTLGVTAAAAAMAQRNSRPLSFVGFDRNDYPGDARLPELRKHFSFTGYWLNNPPGGAANTWAGHRTAVRQAGFGFLLLFNGCLDRDVLNAAQRGVPPADLGRSDAARAIATAANEGFPAGAIVFLDQEEGSRLLPEQAAYLFGWTEALAASRYRPGVYLSGQPAPDGTGPDGKPRTITTAQDVREHIATQKLHPVVLWVAQDACPPAPGCSVHPPALGLSGTPDAAVWQYAQSPRRPALTQSCAQTYAADGMCYAGASTGLSLDLNVAAESDPSHGR